ncbi:ABC transporter ATP-binding protein [Curvibacter sp. HBC61]|uniref:ABC transporter ATP-binding protein n=1 Tax=Curvibacter cyanobacteriorum TaxID=3026422 RepID=A0ABT5N4U4_9BURK|nr:ABC transporter ATP-binding protein [Curvibacter sp. HBC61]MDD0840671.1 ABC transporter ATP-binding protein [Curvibacter sp. HBC61]
MSEQAPSPTLTAVADAPLLAVHDLSVAYGKIEALTQASLTVQAGEIVTVIGPNGAGKSTLLAALMGVLPTRQGQIQFQGEALGDSGVNARVARGLALVPETRALFASMSVEDNLRLGAFRFRRDASSLHQQALQEVFALFPRLQERRSQLAATLSGGERQMLALGRALMGRPRLLMLDEPSLGLAPLIVRDIFRIIEQLRRQGVSILLVEQNARAALKVADRAYVLELGRVVMQGPAAELADDPRIVETYLGLHSQHQDKLAA